MGSLVLYDHLVYLEMGADVRIDLADDPLLDAAEDVLHLHGLDDCERLALLHPLARGHI